jgi:hypothetical protein
MLEVLAKRSLMRFTRVLLVTALLALIAVPAAFALRFTDGSYMVPAGTTGQPYSHTFEGAGGCGPALPYQFRILGGTLPPGLSLATSGHVTGIPTQPGEWLIWVELSDENPPSADWCRPETAQREFTFKIFQGLSIQQQSVGNGYISEPYSVQLTATGGGSQVWSVNSGNLPAGITLSPTGALTGTPTTEGDYTFSVKVADGLRVDTETYTLKVAQRLKVTKAAVPGAEVGFPFSFSPQATGGRPGLAWALSGGPLPSGLTFDAGTGQIGGKPTVAGTVSVKLTVTDTLGQTATLDVPIAVAPRLVLLKKALKAATVGVAYKIRLATQGGVAPRRFTFLGGLPGVLPRGLKLNGRTGELAGKPTKAGTYRIRIQVTDKLGAKSTVGFVLKVKA